jgi:hypothetical protein
MKATACEPKAMLSMNTQVLCRSCPMLARSTWGLAPCGLGAVVLVGAVDVISHPSHVRFRVFGTEETTRTSAEFVRQRATKRATVMRVMSARNRTFKQVMSDRRRPEVQVR